MEGSKRFGFGSLPQVSCSLGLGGGRTADQRAPGRKLWEGTRGRQRQKLGERHCVNLCGDSQISVVKILQRSLTKVALGSGSLETHCVDGLWSPEPPRLDSPGCEGPGSGWLPLAVTASCFSDEDPLSVTARTLPRRTKRLAAFQPPSPPAPDLCARDSPPLRHCSLRDPLRLAPLPRAGLHSARKGSCLNTQGRESRGVSGGKGWVFSAVTTSICPFCRRGRSPSRLSAWRPCWALFA